MKKLLLLPTLFIGLGLLNSCGDAGVQVIVGDEYDTEFIVLGLNVANSVQDGASTQINPELLEYGDFIRDVEVKSVVLSFEGINTPFQSDASFDISGQSVTLTDIETSNTASYSLTGLELSAFETILQNNGEVSVSYDITSVDPNASDAFNLVMSFEVFATIDAD